MEEKEIAEKDKLRAATEDPSTTISEIPFSSELKKAIEQLQNSLIWTEVKQLKLPDLTVDNDSLEEHRSKVQLNTRVFEEFKGSENETRDTSNLHSDLIYELLKSTYSTEILQQEEIIAQLEKSSSDFDYISKIVSGINSCGWWTRCKAGRAPIFWTAETSENATSTSTLPIPSVEDHPINSCAWCRSPDTQEIERDLREAWILSITNFRPFAPKPPPNYRIYPNQPLANDHEESDETEFSWTREEAQQYLDHFYKLCECADCVAQTQKLKKHGKFWVYEYEMLNVDGWKKAYDKELLQFLSGAKPGLVVNRIKEKERSQNAGSSGTTNELMGNRNLIKSLVGGERENNGEQHNRSNLPVTPGLPSSPPSACIQKTENGGHMSWTPPANANTVGKIIEYHVFLAIRAESVKDCPIKNGMVFKRIYNGSLAECHIQQSDMDIAHVDQNSKPALVLRVCAKNEKGCGPATQIRWLQEEVDGTNKQR